MFEETNQTEVMNDKDFTINEGTGDNDPELLFDEPKDEKKEEEKYSVKYNGEKVALTLDELKTNAQKGMNYDKVKAQRDSLAINDDKSFRPYYDFLEAYPEVDPKSIPQEVWENAIREGSLLSAYRKHENTQLKTKLEAVIQNEKNKKNFIGSAKTMGEQQNTDPFLSGLMG